MKNIREMLQDADPLRHEPMPSSEEHAFRREAFLAKATAVGGRSVAGSRSRLAIFAAVALAMIVVALLGVRAWSPLISEVHAAVRFEVRLAEEKPAPGLREAKVAGSDRSVYLHNEIIVSNSDISAARIIQGSDASQYAVSVAFNSSGAGKMRAATGNNIGKLAAILLDGQVVMAPVIRSAIGDSAMITGNFTRAQAETIVNGLTAP